MMDNAVFQDSISLRRFTSSGSRKSEFMTLKCSNTRGIDSPVDLSVDCQKFLGSILRSSVQQVDHVGV